jgi:hypothetical protein
MELEKNRILIRASKQIDMRLKKISIMFLNLSSCDMVTQTTPTESKVDYYSSSQLFHTDTSSALVRKLQVASNLVQTFLPSHGEKNTYHYAVVSYPNGKYEGYFLNGKRDGKVFKNVTKNLLQKPNEFLFSTKGLLLLQKR